MNRLEKLIVIVCVSGSVATAAQSPSSADERRGELLYSTYCNACHTTQVHWREKKLATDWASLKAEVRRWLGNAGLALGEDDVAAIARYLNVVYYHFPSADEKELGQTGAVWNSASRQ